MEPERRDERGEELAELRRKVDAVNVNLLHMLNKRATLVLALSDIKRRRGLAFYAPAREAHMLTMIQGANRGPLTPHQVERVFRMIFAVCLDVMNRRGNSDVGPE